MKRKFEYQLEAVTKILKSKPDYWFRLEELQELLRSMNYRELSLSRRRLLRIINRLQGELKVLTKHSIHKTQFYRIMPTAFDNSLNSLAESK